MQIVKAKRLLEYSLKSTVARAMSWTSNATPEGPLSGSISTAAQWTVDNRKGEISRVHEAERLLVPENSAAMRKAPKAIRAAETVRFNDLYTARLPNVRVLDGEGGLILDNRLVLDMSPHYGYSRYDHYALIRRQLPPPRPIDGSALVLTGIDARNHYHWLLDILPRYEVARLSGFTWDHIIGPTITPAHSACYERLGIDHRNVIRPPYQGQLALSEAIVSSFPSLRFAPSPFAVRFIRRLFDDCLVRDPSLPGRIYVSRRHCQRRRVLNEVEVESALARLGIESVLLEDMDLAQQVRLFANADLIVAPHGAGLANCAFCRPGTQLIELFGTRYTPGFFRRLAAICGIGYRCLVEDDATRGREDTIHLEQAMRIDLEQLLRLVARYSANEKPGGHHLKNRAG